MLREAGPWIVDALAERSRRSAGQRPARLVATQTEVLAIRDQLVGISWTETGHSQTFRQKYELSVGWHSGAEAFQVPPAVHWIMADPTMTNTIRQWIFEQDGIEPDQVPLLWEDRSARPDVAGLAFEPDDGPVVHSAADEGGGVGVGHTRKRSALPGGAMAVFRAVDGFDGLAGNQAKSGVALVLASPPEVTFLASMLANPLSI